MKRIVRDALLMVLGVLLLGAALARCLPGSQTLPYAYTDHAED